jgi:hypothetical protein
VGALAVAALFGAPWSVRVALLLLLIAGGAGYVIWTRRR